jgi:hypothetical protein
VHLFKYRNRVIESQNCYFCATSTSELVGRRLRRPKGDNAASIFLVPYHKSLLRDHLLFAKRDCEVMFACMRTLTTSYRVASYSTSRHVRFTKTSYTPVRVFPLGCYHEFQSSESLKNTESFISSLTFPSIAYHPTLNRTVLPPSKHNRKSEAQKNDDETPS